MKKHPACSREPAEGRALISVQARDVRVDLDDILVAFDDDVAPPPPSPHELRALLDGPATPSSARAAVPAGIRLPRILPRRPRKLAALTAAAVVVAVIATDGRGPATTTPPLDAAAPLTDAPPAYREQPRPKRHHRKPARPRRRRKPRAHRTPSASRTLRATTVRAPQATAAPAPHRYAPTRPSHEPQPQPPKGSHFTSEFTP